MPPLWLGARQVIDGDVEAAAALLGGVTLGDSSAVSKRFQVLVRVPGLEELAVALRAELVFRVQTRKAAGFLA